MLYLLMELYAENIANLLWVEIICIFQWKQYKNFDVFFLEPGFGSTFPLITNNKVNKKIPLKFLTSNHLDLWVHPA